ncbi:hypothetical protein [Mycolicibacterium aichiense]|uniref:Uncharacterized protein n=1 Tax=Mycolicibacterium aichiense TaxID=1799 RepID=A0AAD1HQK5_9MYCO|nr:hypothetical protein [Mycolicibacterium aichiense]MCV7016289.1 hypothetical protein [Mycolicibacterium aichiense]BBX09943.1 hypothetical protein MAIC_47460 [Mycolicibacterium aichiense]STZ26392.1 Uncharacterised protein [Mycolicibacterium aichiense]
MKAVDLVAQAQSILTTRASGGLSARMAAFLARRALEEIIDARCTEVDARAPSANTRSQLLILRVLDDAEVASRAAVAWHRLSNACHLHAYELQPSVAEVQQLCGVVAGLVSEA